MAKLTYQQKLDALAYRFYQGAAWEPKAGDFYTTRRADLELYQVVSVEGGVVRTRYTEGSDAISEWPEGEFLTGGFGPKRVFVPEWVICAPSRAEPFQARVQPWMMECFGPMIAGDREERNHRFLEEALELVEACGCTASEAHQLVDYVYGLPIGEPHQEVGGVMVTLAALCLANSLDMHEAGETELARVWTKVEVIRAKQAAKPKHSPLPVASRIDEGRFEAWTLMDFAAECRAQSRDQLDPDFSLFMAELAKRLTATETSGTPKTWGEWEREQQKPDGDR